jgi:hypothetical protein
VQPLIPTLTFEQLRQAKKNASKSLESLEIDLSSSTAGNLVANIFGFVDWNTAGAITKNNAIPDDTFIPPLIGRVSSPVPTAFSNTNFSMDAMFNSEDNKCSLLHSKISGYFEKIGHSYKDAVQLATIAESLGLDEYISFEYMTMDETVACIINEWHCAVLKFLPENKKTFDSEHFSEYLEVYDAAGPNEKAMKHYLDIVSNAKSDLDTFDAKLRRILNITKKDVEYAIDQYNISRTGAIVSPEPSLHVQQEIGEQFIKFFLLSNDNKGGDAFLRAWKKYSETSAEDEEIDSLDDDAVVRLEEKIKKYFL